MKRTSVLRKILKLVIPIVSITLVLMMIANYRTSYRTQKSFFEEAMQELAGKSAKEVTMRINNQRSEIQMLAQDAVFENMDENEYGKKLSAIATASKDIYDMLFVVYPDGRYYIANKGFSNANVSDRSYFKEIFIDGKSFAMNSPDVSKSTGVKKYTVAVPIKKTALLWECCAAMLVLIC